MHLTIPGSIHPLAIALQHIVWHFPQQALKAAQLQARSETWLAWWQVIRDRGGFWAPYLTFITICVSYASVAGCLVSFGAPLAAGSGIPEVKTYLNGVHIKGECSGRSITATC